MGADSIKRWRKVRGRWVVAGTYDDTPKHAGSTGEFSSGALIRERYEIVSSIGSGGFGRAFECRDSLFENRLFVLKFGNTPEDDVRLQGEFQRSWDSNHRHVCRCSLDRDEKGRLFLVLEHGGRSIARVMEEDGPLAPELAIDVVAQIAEALDHAHAQHIIHLDVSPANVLLDEERFARLTDFGAAALAEPDVDAGVTTVSATVNSFNQVYVAPEVLLQLQGQPRSDQYSLALVLSAMLRGQDVEPRASRPDRAQLFPGLTPAQLDAVLKATDSEPSRRFSTCGAFIDALATGADVGARATLARRHKELLARIDRELLRGDGRSDTSKVGGAMLIGGALESYLRAALHFVIEVEELSEETVRENLQVVNPNATRLERTTLGTLAQLLRRLAPDEFRALGPLVEDLKAPGSVVKKAIEERNATAHGREIGMSREMVVRLRQLLTGML